MTEPTSYQLAILNGLQRQPHVYGGTVDYWEIQSRRARNKRTRASRRINRRRSA